MLRDCCSSYRLRHVIRGKPRSLRVEYQSDSTDDRMSFDYCVVAVGVANGLWKPRAVEELSGVSACDFPSETGSSACLH